METSGESQQPLIVQDSVASGSGTPAAHLETQTNYDSHMASSESQRYRYRHEPTRTRRIGGRHLFPHPRHAYPLTNAGAVLNIDCVLNTDDVIKEWVKALLVYQGITRTEGVCLKTFIPLTLSGKVANWFQALPEETKG